jgi:hypothetical protein
MWVWDDGEQELWTKQMGHLLLGKQRSNLQGSSVKEEEE